MKAGCPLHVSVTALLALAFGPALVLAQTTINLSGPTRTQVSPGVYTYNTWKPIKGSSTSAYRTADGSLYDPNDDQQTGQYDSDFAGNTNLPSFFIQTGLINGVEVIAMRVIFNTYDTNIASGTYTGNPVNVRVGINANWGKAGDGGKLDLYMGPNFQNGAASVGFQMTGTGLNVSPSTTSVSNIFYPDANASTLGGGTAPTFSANNFSYVELSTATAATYYPGWTNQQEATGSNKAPGSDGMMSWAIPLVDINRAIAEVAIADAANNPSLAGTVITAESFLMWVAFTSTQNNSVNQDAYGLKASDNQDTRWDSFTNPMNAYGYAVPEPSAYGLALGAGLGAFLCLRRRRAQNLLPLA